MKNTYIALMEISPIHTFQIGNSFPIESPVYGKFPMFVKHGFIVFKVTAPAGHISYGFLTLLYPENKKMIRPHENVIHENVLSKKEETESGAPFAKPVCLLFEANEALAQHLILGFESGQKITRYQENGTIIEYVIFDNLDWANQLIEMFANHDSLVIADGHHRTAAYFAIKEKSKKDPGLFSAMMSINQVEVRSYHRKIRIKEKYWSDFYTLLHDQYSIYDLSREGEAELTSVPQPDQNSILMYTQKGWKILNPKKGGAMNRPGSADLLAHFESNIIDLFCDQFGFKVNNIIRYISGSEVETEKLRLKSGEILLLFPPVSSEFLWSSSHRDEILPAKSTWIEPRMPSNIIKLPNTI